MVILTVGVVFSFIVLPATGLIWTFVLAIAAAAACVVFLPYPVQDGQDSLLRPAAARAGLVCSGFVGVVGLIALLGAALAPLVLAAAALSPRAIGALKRWARKVHSLPQRTETGRFAGPAPVASPSSESTRYPTIPDLLVSGLSDAELCRTWRGTYLRVIGAGTFEELSRLYSLRRACLDELEVRDPVAFASWIKTGARASGDPEKFFTKNTQKPRRNAA